MAMMRRAVRPLSTNGAALSASTRRLLDDTGALIPVVKGPMYPGSNPELVAAVSEAGGFGVVQPISLTKLYGHDFREGLRLIKSLTSRPFGVNLTIVENKRYMKQMEEWMDIAVDEGVRWFLTSLGKPDKIVRFAEKHGVKVYHDAHTPHVARKVADAGVHGLNCLNDSMGGQTGNRSAETFVKELQAGGFGELPLLQAGGVGDADGLRRCLDMGYAGAQVGTRFLATTECIITTSYKQAICKATSDDIVWTNKVRAVASAQGRVPRVCVTLSLSLCVCVCDCVCKLAGTNSSVIRTPQVEEGGLRVGPLTAWLLANRYTKLLTRTYMLTSAIEKYRKAAFEEDCELWQAGKGVDAIQEVLTCKEVLDQFGEVARVSV